MTHFLSKVFTLIAFLKYGACHRKVPNPSKCLFQISSSLQKKEREREKYTFPLFHKMPIFFPKHLFPWASGMYYTSAQQILIYKNLIALLWIFIYFIFSKIVPSAQPGDSQLSDFTCFLLQILSEFLGVIFYSIEELQNVVKCLFLSSDSGRDRYWSHYGWPYKQLAKILAHVEVPLQEK